MFTTTRSGYPKILCSQISSKHSKIITISDAFEAMCSNKFIPRQKPLKEAKIELNKKRSTQFNPVITDIFLTKAPEFYKLIKEKEV